MKSEYALRAMLELAEAHGKRPLQSGEIAARRRIPESYLEQILTVLRKAGLVVSVRGPQGGHALALAPSRITARDVVEALEGPLLVTENGTGHDGDPYGSESSLRELWSDVRSAIESALGRVSLEDLAAREMVGRGRPMYHI